MTISRTPILLNSCARAATAAEARYRIDAPIAPTRGTRLLGLDLGAAALMRRVAEQTWAGARFFARAPGAPPDGADLALLATDGTTTRLDVELDGADVAVMVATTDDVAGAAAVVGQACARRGIMTAGLVLPADGDGAWPSATVAALRPYAQVLIVTRDDEDLAAILSALRA